MGVYADFAIFPVATGVNFTVYGFTATSPPTAFPGDDIGTASLITSDTTTDYYFWYYDQFSDAIASFVVALDDATSEVVGLAVFYPDQGVKILKIVQANSR